MRRAQRTHGTTDPGGVCHPVHGRECLTILLGTYAENGRCNRRTTTCIVFGTQHAHACIVAATSFVALMPAVQLVLKKKSHSFSARMRLGYPHVLYNTGTNHRLKKHPSCMANPFHLLGMNQPVQGGWWLFDLQIPIGRNGQAEAKWDKHAVYRIQCRSSVAIGFVFSA